MRPPTSDIDLLGFKCENLTLAQASASLSSTVAEGDPRTVLFLNAAKVTDRDTDYRSLLAATDSLLADGQSIYFASRLLGTPLVGRVAGVDLMEALLKIGSNLGWRVFFLGSTDEVLKDVVTVVGAKYPGVEVVGTRNGYFDPSLDESIASEISRTSPDILFVAMPSPRKENWVLSFGWKTGARVSMGIGGSLEVLTGRVTRAPSFLQTIGLEWAWRVGQEPKRLWRRYASSNLRFLLILARERFRTRRSD